MATRGSAAVQASLIATAAELFAERGPRAVSVREVADAAGVNHGLVHHYFGSKAGLVTAVLDHLAAEATDEINEHEPPSVFYATGLIGLFYLMTFVLGFGAMVLVGPDVITSVDRGGNMAAPLLAELLGGTPFLGFIAAVAFATILAVVAGLTLSGAAALSHDLWVNVVKHGEASPREQLRVARGATIGLGLLAIALGITFKGQNVAFMVSLAFAIAASGNFPALVLSIFWRRCTTAGAVASMVVGTVSTLVLIYLSPTIQVDILKHAGAWFPLKNPALGTIPLSFTTGIVVSLLTSEASARDGFARLERRMHLGADPVPAGDGD